MGSNTTHKALILDYIKKSNLEIIVQNSIRSLLQTNLFPDNPFGAMCRHFTYFSAKDDLNRLQQKVKSFELKPLDPPGLFSVTSQTKELECFGLAHILHYVDAIHFKILSKTLKEMCLEHKKTYGQYTLEVRVAIGGSEIFVSNFIPHPEVAPTPLEIRAECIVEGPKFEEAFNLFADYVYEDIMRIGSNNALNLVRDFCVEHGPNSTYVKRVSLAQMQDNKQLLVHELKNATIQKRVSYIRVLVFSTDMQRLTNKDLIRAVTPSRLLSTTEPSVLDHFQFISTKKCYILHHTTTGNPTDFSSLSPVPCIALYNSLFPNPDSARHYAKIFYTENQSPYTSEALDAYQQYKRDRVIKYFINGKTVKMVWETLELVLANRDHTVNIGITNEILSLFAHPSCKLYRISKMLKALIVLINSFYDTGFEHFKKLAEGLFVRVKEECWSAFGNASSAEMLILRPQIIRMLNSTSVNKSRTLKISSSTLRILERLEFISVSLAKNSTELLMRHLSLLGEAHSRLLFAYNIAPGLTHQKLLEEKQTVLYFDVDAELKSQNLRKDNEYSIIYEYLVKTQIMEVLILTTRDLVLSYPLLPNPLKTFAAKIMSALYRHDMFRLPREELMEKHIHIPEDVGQGVFLHGGPDNKYNLQDLPYTAGIQEYLLVCSWEEIGFFRTIFKEYELNIDLFAEVFVRGYSVQGLLAVCGMSLVNTDVLMKFPSLWHVYNDVFITGPSFNAASQSFLDLLIRYALWLDGSTDALVLGFFTPFSETPLASFSDLISPSERKQSTGMILSAFQMNTRVWLRFIIPYEGEPRSEVVGIPIAVHVYFNMHFRVSSNKKITSLVPIASLEDIVKVFYSKEDLELWREVVDVHSHEIKEKLMNEMNDSFDNGQHYRGCVCLLFIKVLESNQDSVGSLLRINETPLKIIIEAGRFAGVMLDILRLSGDQHRKRSEERDINWGVMLKKFVEVTFLDERNIFLENAQLGMLRVTDQLVEAMTNTNGPKYVKAIAAISILTKHLKAARLVGSIVLHDLLQDTKDLAS